MQNSPAAPLAARKRHALVVEDDVLVRMAIVDMLEMAGHGAEEAADGETALRRLEANGRDFDILISDIALPGLSGEDLAVAVYRRWPAIRIVLVSGRDRVNLPDGTDSVQFLPKPFQFEDLLRVVET